MDSTTLKEILEKHDKWLCREQSGERADLRSANLSGADLRSANLYGANFRSADLRGANLRSADLRSADLRSANLSGADLRRAYLNGAYLNGANLSSAYLPNFQIVPSEGGFIAWKKVIGGICKLLIPADAKRTSSLVGRKCRAEYVKVLAIFPTEMDKTVFYSTHDDKTVYSEGVIVRPDKYDDDIRIECTSGIHFFMTRKEAEEYS